MQGNFLYTVLVVAFDESIKSATRISSIYSFASVITGLILGGIVFMVRRLKRFIVVGTCLFMVAFELLIHYRGGTSDSSYFGVIRAQICLGIAGGMFPYPAQASIQAATKHERKSTKTSRSHGPVINCLQTSLSLHASISRHMTLEVRSVTPSLMPCGNR